MAVRGPFETFQQTPILARPEFPELIHHRPPEPDDLYLPPNFLTPPMGTVHGGPASPQFNAGEVLGLTLSLGALASSFFAPRFATPLMIGAIVSQFFWPAQAEAKEAFKPAFCQKEKKIKEEPYWIHIAVASVVGGLGVRYGLVPQMKFFRNLSKKHPNISSLLLGKEWVEKPYHDGFWNKNRVVRLVNRIAHHWGAIALPTVAFEVAMRKAAGYEHQLSFTGGLTLMLFWHRLGTQHLGADKSGSTMLLIIDRLYDMMIQQQSGQPQNDTNWWYVANRYGAISLVCGSYRARHLRDWLSKRRGQGFLRSVWVESGEGRSPTLVYKGGLHKLSLWAHKSRARDYQWWMKKLKKPSPNLQRRFRDNQARLIEKEEKQLVGKILRSSNSNNTVWVDEAGRLCRKDTGRALGALLDQREKEMLSTMMGGTGFSSLFVEGVGTGVIRIGEQRYRQLKVGSQFGGGGFLLYWFLQEVATAPIVISAAWALCGEDLMQNAQFSIFKAPLTIPRLFLRYRLGVDTAPAMIFDRFWKYATEPYISKMFPLLASQGLFRKRYQEAICAESPDEFAYYHIGPKVVHGGLGSYNRHIADLDNLAETVAPLLRRADFSGPSPYSPVGISYRLLAKFYAGEKDGDYEGLGLEEIRGVEGHLKELIEEAKRRARGEQRELLTYRSDTVIELALAISAAAYYANYKDHRRFERLIQEHQDWFRQVEKAGKDLDQVEDFVNSLPR